LVGDLDWFVKVMLALQAVPSFDVEVVYLHALSLGIEVGCAFYFCFDVFFTAARAGVVNGRASHGNSAHGHILKLNTWSPHRL